jgi:hypothetical protein
MNFFCLKWNLFFRELDLSPGQDKLEAVEKKESKIILENRQLIDFKYFT